MDFVDISALAEQFVLQYYTVMNKCPELLHRFYGEDSTVIYESAPICGQSQIYNAFVNLKFNDTHVLIHKVDALKANGNSVLIQVCGEINIAGAAPRRFMRSFTLCEKTQSDFYVLNDIFRFQDRVYLPEVTDTKPTPEPVVEPSQHVAPPSEPQFAREKPLNGVVNEQSWHQQHPQHYHHHQQQPPQQHHHQQQPTQPHQQYQHQKDQQKRHEPAQAPPSRPAEHVERHQQPIEHHQPLPPREPSPDLEPEPTSDVEQDEEKKQQHPPPQQLAAPPVVEVNAPPATTQQVEAATAPVKRPPMSWAQRASSNTAPAAPVPAAVTRPAPVSYPKPAPAVEHAPARHQAGPGQRGGGAQRGGRPHPIESHRELNTDSIEAYQQQQQQQPRFQQQGGGRGGGGGARAGGGQQHPQSSSSASRGGGPRGSGGAQRGGASSASGGAAGFQKRGK